MKRYLSLDVLRGLTVACMILVNNPGSRSAVYAPLRHTAWTGCTPTDLVFPFFVFCMGVAMAFSFVKFGGLNKLSVKKILLRGAGIFIVGLLLNMFPFYPTNPDPSLSAGQNWANWFGHIRIFGVLQRIAMCYVLGSLLALWLKTPARIFGAVAVLSVAYTAILLIFGSEPGAFTLEGTVSRKIDVALVGEGHVYHGYRFADGTVANFDPEGPLGTLTGTCTALLGFLVGSMIRRSSIRYAAKASSSKKVVKDSPAWVVSRIYTYAVLSLAFGVILSIWIPISKPLWSVSYVFYSAGWAMLVLAFFAFFIDVKGIEKPFTPFRAFGLNPLFLYAMSGVLAKILSDIIGWDRSAVFGANEFTSLLYSLLFVFVHFIAAWVLYRKKIVIKL